MKIDRNLNMVLRLNDEDGNQIVTHTASLPTAIFETSWKFFKAVYDEMSDSGNIQSSMVLARQIFMDVAQTTEKTKAAQEILDTIVGATYIAVEGKNVLFAESPASDDIKGEILSKILFFIVFQRHVLPSVRKEWTSKMLPALGLELTLSSATDTLNLSTTSITPERISKKAV